MRCRINASGSAIALGIIPAFLTLILISCQKNTALVLENDIVSFSFKEGSYSLIGLRDIEAQMDHISPDTCEKELWKLTFAKGEEQISTNNIISRDVKASIGRTGNGGKTLKVLWNDLGLEELAGIKVEVKVNLPDDSGIADWHINVINDSDSWGLWDIEFPKIMGFLDTSNYNLFGSFGHRDGRSETWGSLYKNYKSRLNMRYPDGWGAMSMQFIGASNAKSSVYMASHDPLAWKKDFVIEPGNEFYIRVYAENMGVAGSGYNDPFPYMLGVFKGNWLTAAKIYRKFAITAPWVSKGKVSEAETTPQSFKNVALWIRGWEYPVADTAEYNKRMKQWKYALEYFDVPMGFHWYNWSINDFDTHYPHFFPARAGVEKFTRELTGMGVVVMPYINGRIVDKRNDDIADFVPLAAKKADGSTYEEKYGNQVPQMVMCPVSTAYQDTIAGAIKRLADDIGFNSVYIDQVTAAPSNLCFDTAHGHPLGGGSWWIEGYREMLNKVQKVAHEGDRNLSITSECTAEPYMDGIDGYLLVNPRSDKSIPLLSAVYSGYTIYFASWLEGLKSDRVFISTIGRDVLWGCKPGWFDFDRMFSPENKKKLEYFRDLGHVHNAGKKYLVYGEFLSQWESDARCSETNIPLQICTLWKAEDGSLALFVANLDEKPAPYKLDIDLAAFAENDYSFSNTFETLKDIEASIGITDQKIKAELNLAPLEIKIIEITK